MSTETITLEVDADAAQAFKSVSAEQRAKLQVLLGIWLKEYSKLESSTLSQTMTEISDAARSRGMTPEILDSILKQD